MGLRAGSSKIRSLIATGRDNRRPNVINQYRRKSDFIDYDDPTTQKIVAVFGVVKENDNNYVALKISCSAGYTVNWGDGTTENFSNQVRANHQFSWEDFSSSDEITLDGITYRQAKVVITAQSSGQITSFDFQERHDDIVVKSNKDYNANWLEITANTPYVTSLEHVIGGGTVLMRALQSINIISVAANCVKADHFAYMCQALKKVEFGFDTSQINDWRYAFYYCMLLEDLENVDFSGTTTSDGLVGMFIQCRLLKRVPSSFYNIDFTNSSINTLSDTFNGCYSIDKIEYFDTSNITNWYYAFGNCRRLLYIPKFDTSAATTFYRTFNGCYNLREIPEYDTSNVTNFREAFRYCYNLKTIPKLDTSSGTNFYYTFAQCYNMQSLPFLDLTSATNIQGMFEGMSTIEHIEMDWPTYYTNTVTALFSQCNSLISIKGIPSTWMPNNMQQIFYNCYTLTEIPAIDTRRVSYRHAYYHTFYNCDGIKTIPESLFYGLSNTTNDDWYRAFYSCDRLEELPTSFTTQISNISFYRSYEMFRYCRSLRDTGTIQLSAITSDGNQNRMFRDCNNLSKATVLGCKYNLDFYYDFLQRDQIVAIFNNLENASKNINIQYNPGLADLTDSDRAIATNKGWTITE